MGIFKRDIKPDVRIVPEGEKYEPTFWEEYIYWPIWRKWDWLEGIPRRIKWFIQRGRRGYSDCDVWNLESYLADWLPHAFRHLKRIGHGCRGDLFDRSKKDGDECWKWKEILEEMAQGFEAYGNIICLTFIDEEGIDEKERKRLYAKFNRAHDLFKEYFESLWD